LNQDDLQQPSYKMVDVPTEDDSKQSSSAAEAKAPRQEAAIKGITPAQPAPIVAEKPKAEAAKATSESEKGLFATICSWFRSAPMPAPAAEPAKPPRTGNPQREGQRDGRRGGRNNRNGGEREGREPRGNREQKESREPRPAQGQGRDDTQKPREPKETREPREPRRQRGEPRPDRKDQAVAAAVADMTPVANGVAPGAPEQSTEESGSGNARRRGRRGGRRERGEPRENQVTEVTEQNGEGSSAPAASAQTVVEMAAAVVAPSVITVAPTMPVSAEVSNDQSIVETPVAAQELQAAAPLEASAVVAEAIPLDTLVIPPTPEVAAAPVQEIAVTPVVQAERKVVEPAPAAASVVVDLEKALEQSGLVMVETSSDKAKSWQPEVAASEEAPRPRRKRPAPVVVSDEPLMMVETQK
jgi:ribonuclease E